MEKYENNKNNICGPTGRYIYILSYSSKDISKLPINNVIEKLGLYDKLNDKGDFINKYAFFLSENYF